MNRNKTREKDRNQFHSFVLREIFLYYSFDLVVNKKKYNFLIYSAYCFRKITFRELKIIALLLEFLYIYSDQFMLYILRNKGVKF